MSQVDEAASSRRTLARQESRTLNIKREKSTERQPLHGGLWPTECANDGVKEADGSFFESFTALVWKQENRRRRVASESDGDADRPPPLEGQFVHKTRTLSLSAQEFEQLYIEVLYTIKHKIGTTSGSHLPFIQDLYIYAREAFGVTPEDHARLLARASEEKPPVLILNVTVLEAKALEAKDADGYSDPYCMLGIIPGSRAMREHLGDIGGSYSSDEELKGRKESALKKFSQSFKRKKEKTARDLIPARYIKTTSVKPNTLNPIWNEKFRFDLDDVNSDSLHLDIWDHDDEFSVLDATKQLNQVQGLKGLGRYFKQIAQSARTSSKGNVDDFLGSVNIHFDDIPSTGVDRWYELEGRSARSNVEGQIKLRLTLATREDRGYSEEDSCSEIREHEDLMCVFIDHEVKRFRGDVYQWRGGLSQAAQTILHQHAIQGDITDVQIAMCRWTAYSRKHRQYSFDWGLLLKLLDDLDHKWAPASLERDEENMLADSFTEFIEYCMNLIRIQRDLYPPTNRISLQRLQDMLRCLNKIYDMQVFRHCCPFQKDIFAEMTSVIKKSGSDWYERLRRATESNFNNEEDTIRALIDLTNKLNSDMQRSLQVYSPIYESLVSLSYFALLYRQVEKQLGDDFQCDLKRISLELPDVDQIGAEQVNAQQMGIHLFELYLVLQEFCSFRQQLSQNDRKGLSVTQFYEWFKTPVQRWINVCKYKLLSRVKKAVELDKVGQVDGHIKQSTSAVDVACCFGQIVDFWKSIEWPDYPGAMPFVTKITEDMCHGSTLYADLIHEKLKSAGYYDEIGQFDVTEQLCITINDIEQVRRALRPLPDALQFVQIARCIEKQHGEKAAKAAKTQLYGIVKAADDEMVRKIKQVVDRVADKMRPDIKKDVFHLCWAPERVPAEDAIGDLMNYLDSNLVTLNSNLLRANFDRILDSIWVEVLEEIRDVLETEDVKAMWFFERLFNSLEILVDFFHANDKGLPMNSIKNEHFQYLHRQLRLNKADTQELIETYFMDKLEEQERYEENRFGTLSVRVYYNTDAEILSVEVLNARNLIPLDPNGLSDPFVLIELCPKRAFPQQTVQRTQVVKKSLNPTFDEPFEFCVSTQQCLQRGACVLFTVMDHDFLVSNDFAGETYLSLNQIPGIRGEEVSGFSALKPMTQSLTQPKKGQRTKAKGVLRALELREGDKEAQEFTKKRKDLEAMSQS